MIKNNNKTGGFYNLPNIIHRAIHDNEHPFNIQSARLYEEFKNGQGLELIIMCILLSNKGDAENPTDTDWVTVKEEIRSRTGMAVKKFDKAWKRLKDLGYIENIGTATRAKWVIWENRKPLPSPVEQIITFTGDVLTNIKETINGGKDYSKEFSELYEAYPSKGNRRDGSTYILRNRQEECQKAYTDYLKQRRMTHDEIMLALKVELNDRQMTGNYFQKVLFNWIKDKFFEQYKGKSLEPVDMGYGTEMI